ncbi:uncharacterized protein C8Q71DRAFT_720762 [Rhodofomes roseus]|uniref:Zn(2)-C6 fungal-type domain-containing protein n=1 Tax=Rhodofomes roseus TaxID=34475 RepID=A0ABQ8KT62_9APHY|nr:uncharacterized protein C8Q71DRAFT_720762 [Rhodofomes roseus]KAH9841621.1 hypothetical protein C8Q71DRAFT_720762 [Rhodofomes roseus]
MPQAREPANPYSRPPPPPQLPHVSSSFPPPGARYGGHHESGGEQPVASSSRQPPLGQSFPESYSLPLPGPSRGYEAGRGRIPEARSEYGSPTLGYLRRHLEPEGVAYPDDPRRGRSLPPRRSAGASGSRPLPSRLPEPEERGLYPPPYAQVLPYSRGSPVAERAGDIERRLSPVDFRTRPGSRRSVSPADRRTTLPVAEVERPLLHRFESVPDFRAPPPGYGHGAQSPFPVSYQASTQYDPATMAPRYTAAARLPVNTPYSFDPNAPPIGEVETIASPRYSGPLFSEPRSYQHSLTSHSTHSGDDGNDTEDSVSRRGPEEDAPPEPGPSRRTSRKRRRAEDVEASASWAGSPSRAGESPEPPPRKQSKKTEKACFFCRKRKLRCDGQPLCGNCAKRQVACKYPPGRPKRRGPGKKNLAKQAVSTVQGTLGPLSGPFTFQPPDRYYPQAGEEAAMQPHAMFPPDPPVLAPRSPGRLPGSGSADRPSEDRYFSLGPLGESLGSEYSAEDVVEEGSGGQGTDEEEDDGSTPPER